MNNTTVIKASWMNKFSRSILGDKWKMVYCRLYNGGKFCWFSNEHNMEKKGAANLKYVQAFIAMGDYVKQVPECPRPPSAGYETMLAFPEKPKRSAKTYFFAANSLPEISQWSQAISSCFASVVAPPQATPPYGQATPSYPAQVAYAPAPGGPQSARPPPVGFMMPEPGANVDPYNRPPAHAPGYGPTGPVSGTSYGPSGPSSGPGYGLPPPAGPCYGAPPNIAPGYGAPGPTYAAPAPGYGAPAPGYGAPAPGYGGPGTYPQQVYAPQAAMGGPAYASGNQGYNQPNVQYVHAKPHKSSGYGKLAAGVAGGALAGYAVSSALGGGMFGHGMGWGGSWSSHSWSGCSGGSSGSFGSFGGCSD